MAPLTLDANLPTRWRHLHVPITALPHSLELSYWHYQLVLSWYLHQPESHKLSLNKVSDSVTNGPKDRTPGLHGSDKNCPKIILVRKLVWGRSSLGPNFFDPAYASCKPCKFFLSEKGDKSFVRGLVACIWKVDRSMPRLVSCLLPPWWGGGGGREGVAGKRMFLRFFKLLPSWVGQRGRDGRRWKKRYFF